MNQLYLNSLLYLHYLLVWDYLRKIHQYHLLRRLHPRHNLLSQKVSYSIQPHRYYLGLDLLKAHYRPRHQYYIHHYRHHLNLRLLLEYFPQIPLRHQPIL